MLPATVEKSDWVDTCSDLPFRAKSLLAMRERTPIVYVVDGNGSVRQRLEHLIYEAGWLPSIFASAEEFLSHPRALQPSCLVLDIVLPGLSGLDLQERIAGEWTKMPIIFVAGFSDASIIVRAMKAGAVEFLTKPFSEEVLLEAIQSALDRSRATQGAAWEMRTLQERYASLSTREREVMGLVCAGLMNKQVGGELGISEITVKAHRGRVMKKMKAGSLAELVNIASKLEIRRQGSCHANSIPTANTQKADGLSRKSAMCSL